MALTHNEWRQLGAEFRALAEREGKMLASNPRDLWVKAMYRCGMGEPDDCSITGGFDSALMDEFIEVATRAGRALNCPTGAPPATFWASSLCNDLRRISLTFKATGEPDIYAQEIFIASGSSSAHYSAGGREISLSGMHHLSSAYGGVGQRRICRPAEFCIARRLISSSASYCLRLSSSSGEGKAAPSALKRGRARTLGQKQPKSGDIARSAINTEIRKLKKQGLTARKICERLGDSPRPPQVTWEGESWPAAYRKHNSTVKKYISLVKVTLKLPK